MEKLHQQERQTILRPPRNQKGRYGQAKSIGLPRGEAHSQKGTTRAGRRQRRVMCRRRNSRYFERTVAAFLPGGWSK